MSSVPAVDASGAAAPASPAQAPGPKLEGAALQAALRAQLEFYFSKSNLATDGYLLSQMNSHPNKSVPVDVICGFRKIKSLTEDKAQVLAAMKTCSNLTLDEAADSVRSNLKHERTTLILRDIAPTADAVALRAVFEEREASPAKGRLVSLTADLNDTWFVTFDSEAAAMDTCMDIQAHAFTDKAYTFMGKPVAARVKNESLNRGFYSGPPVTSGAAPGQMHGHGAHAGSSILVGGPVSPHGGAGYAAAAYNPYQYSAYPQQFMPPGAAIAHPLAYGAQYAPLVAPQQQQQQQTAAPGAAQPQLTKAEKKAAAAANVAASASKKEKKKKDAAAAAGASPSAVAAGASPVAADGKPAKKGKKAKAEAAAAAAAAAAAGTVHVVAAPAAPVSAPLVTSAVSAYGHAPRTYTREQMAAVVDQFISMARSSNNSGAAAFKRPDGFDRCNDPEGAVLKSAPSTAFSILEPFPVIYPASPSPLLAAQPHHSSSLPFLDLGGGALDAPYFSADAGYSASQARRKSQTGAAVKKPAAQAAAAATGNFTSKTARPASGPAQPKIVPPPAVQPPSASAAPTKPASFAAAALAAGNAPQQPQPVKAQPRPAAATPAAAAASPAKKSEKAPAKAKKQPAAAAAPAPAAAPAATAKPAVPVVTFASRVGAVSPAEAAAKQASIKQAKEAKERAEQEAKNPGSTTAAPAATPAAAPAAAAPAASKAAPAAAAPAAAPAVAKPAETPAKAAFSYAAMIKKAPATPSPPTVPSSTVAPAATRAAAAPSSTAAPAAVAAAATAGKDVAASPTPTDSNGSIKSDAGNWRAAQ